jgi:hypothetical protein
MNKKEFRWEDLKVYGFNPDDLYLIPVTIAKDGTIYVPQKPWKKFFFKERFVQFYFAKENFLVLRFVDKKSTWGIATITRTKENVRFVARGALECFKIEHLKTRTYLGKVIPDVRAVFVDLDYILKEKK